MLYVCITNSYYIWHILYVINKLFIHVFKITIFKNFYNAKYNASISYTDRIHFYIVYHALNDRYMQELVVHSYRANIDGFGFILPKLQALDPSIALFQQEISCTAIDCYSPDSLNDNKKTSIGLAHPPSSSSYQHVEQLKTPVRRVRVAFMSKFFGLFEPHGMILDAYYSYHTYIIPLSYPYNTHVDALLDEKCAFFLL